MVFESVVTDVLNRVLGDFIENLDSKQLKLGIWGGDVELKDLVLKQSAIDELDLPVQVAYGRLGSLTLKIPWKNLYGAPVIAEIDGLYLLLVPNKQIKYNPEKEEKKQRDAKQAALAKIEERKKKEAEKDKPKQDDTFVEKLTVQIIKNVQVKIANIHVRYEDKVTHPGHPFALGATLSNLSMETTDEFWTPTILQEMVTKIYKSVQLEALGVYWNCNSVFYANLSPDEIVEHLIAETATKESNPSTYKYMLGPINSSVRLKLNPKPENDDPAFSIPKVHLNLEMEKLAVAMNKCQYKDIIGLTESMHLMSKGARYRKYRPDVPSYKGYYKAWWHFAYKCILEGEVRRNRKNWDWNHMKKHCDTCRKYEELYKIKLQSKLNKEQKELLDQCEDVLDVTNITILRQKVELEVERYQKMQPKGKGWLSGWWWSGTKDTEESANDIVKQFEAAMTPEEKKRLYQAIDYQENTAPPEYPESYVDMTAVFVLRTLETDICDTDCALGKVLTSKLSGVKCRLETRAASNAIYVAVNIDNLTVHGFRQQHFTPLLVGPVKEEEALLDVFFETNPLDKKCGQRLKVETKPLRVVYDAKTINKILDIFKVPESSALEKLSSVAENKLNNIKEMSATGLQYMIESHSYFDVDINISAPFIIIPQDGVYRGNENVLVIFLGKANITSVERSTSFNRIKELYKQGAAGEEIMKEMIEKSYDKFLMTLTEIQVVLATEKDDWMECFTKGATQLHLLRPLSLEFIFSKCLITDDPNLPLKTLKGELPSLALNITNNKLIMLLSLINSLPLPNQDVPENKQIEKKSSSSSLMQYIEMSKVKTGKQDIKPKVSTDSEELIQFTELDVKFVLKEITLAIGYHVTEENEEDFATFKIGYVECDFTQHTFNTEVWLRVGSMNLQQFSNGQPFDVISSPLYSHNEYMFTVQFVQVHKMSPEFHTKHQSCESRLISKFNSLDIVLNQEFLLEMIKFVTNIQVQLEGISQNKDRIAYAGGGESLKVPLDTLAEESFIKIKKSSTAIKKHSKKPVIETIKFKLVASLQEVKLRLCNNKYDITSLAVSGVNVELLSKQPYTQIKAQLVDLSVLNHNCKTTHPKILSVASEEMINIQFVLYNIDEDDFTSTNMSVDVCMGRLRVVILNQFVDEVLGFLNHFQNAVDAIIEASQNAAQQAKQNVEEAISKALKIAFNINIKAPNILIPIHSQSKDALLLDFGLLHLTNKFKWLEIFNESNRSAVLDEMQLTLDDMKIAKVVCTEKDPIIQHTMLEPVSVQLKLLRNLSSSWYLKTPDLEVFLKMKTIALLLAKSDYNLVMSILNKNLSEGRVETLAPPKIQPKKQTKKGVNSSSAVTVKVAVPQEQESEKDQSRTEVRTTIKFNFVMESFIITLFSNPLTMQQSISPHDPKLSLAKFSLEMISLKGRILSDGSMGVSMLLLNCIMEDTRAGREGKLNRLCERKQETLPEEEREKTPESSDIFPTRSMLDVVFQQKGNDNFVDVRICSFALILSADFILQILEYLKHEEEEGEEILQKPAKNLPSQVTVKSSRSSQLRIQQPPTDKLLTINLRIEKPDIILVEHLDNIDTKALILNLEMLFKLRTAANHQVLNGNITDLQMYTCCFNPAKRADTKGAVINPINVCIAGSTPEGQGLHIEVQTSDIHIRVSPLTIELLNRVNATLVSHATAKKEAEEIEQDLSDLWDPKPYKEDDFWFLKAEVAEEASIVDEEHSSVIEQKGNEKKKELCLLMLRSIIVTLEAGVGNKTLPMLLLESTFQGTIKDWSSQLGVEASLTLQMGYYNSRLALWEPLVEPVQFLKGHHVTYKPWELKIELHMNPEVPFEESVATPGSDTEMEEINLPPTPMIIDISSSNNLEITVTRTFLEVLNNLSKAFTTDLKTEELKRSVESAPFRVKNDTGMSIIIRLGQEAFKLYGNTNPDEIVLESGSEVFLELKPTQEKEASLNLQQELALGNSKTMNRFILIEVPEMETSLKLPFERADKRFFPIDSKTNKGFITEVVMENAVLMLTLRSILKVFNYFDVPIEVYYMTERENELESILTIEPGTSENVPFKAVYTSMNELFFSVQDYDITSIPFIWTDLNPTVSISKSLLCNPKANVDHTEPFIIKVIGEMEQVFHEKTTRHTISSVCYNIYLKPAVILKNCLPFNITCVVDKILERHVVQPGVSLQLPNVDPGQSTICITIPDYLEKEWSCKREILQNPSEFAVWQFSSYDSTVKVNLDLGMHVKKNGSMVLSLYCPFWMINKTGLTLDYRTAEDNMNILTHPNTYSGPILFSFSAKNFFGKKKASIREHEGHWSDKFPLDVAGSSGYIVCKGKDMIYMIGVRNQLTHNGFTKQVTFTPYYVIINNANYSIEWQEFDRPGDPWQKVKAKSCAAVWPRTDRDDKLIKIRVGGTEEVTPPFIITQSHEVLLKLKNKYGGIHVDIQITESTGYITLDPYMDGLPPPMIINHTDLPISYWEKETVQIKKLEPGHQVIYTWDNPPGCRVLAWDIGHKKEMQDDLRRDGLKEFSPMENYNVYWVSFLNGMQRVILFTLDRTVAANVQSAKQFEAVEKEINVSIHGIGISLVNNHIQQELMYIAIANSGIIWECAKLKSKLYKEMSVRDSYNLERAYQKYLIKIQSETPDLGREMVDEKTEVDFETLQMFKPHKRKLRRVFQNGLWIQMKTSQYQLQLHAKINKVQIDNQLYDSIFPIILAPVPPPRTMSTDNYHHRPFVEVSIVQRLMKYSQIKQFKYFKVLIQEFHIKVDVGFISFLLDLLQTSELTDEEEHKQFLENVKSTEEPLHSLVSSFSQQEQKNFYDLLHFSPLKIHVSFSLQSGSYKGLSQLDVVNILLQGLGVTLTDMQDVIFKLAYFERNYSFLSQRQLVTEATYHYSNQAIKQLYVLVLGLDVLGNPYGLVLGITKGFEDFFYEPFQGAIQGPGEFAEGLVLGARSLFSHTVGGAAGAVSRITGAMGKGIAALTFDKDYQRRRREAKKKKPASMQEGLARGGKGLVMGVVDGVTGVFTKPITGAKQEGVEGFFKGLGKGAIGLVTRPTAGVIDFASDSFDAVKRATDLQEEISKMRPTRYLQSDGLVRPYNKREAEGNKILVELEKGKYYSTDRYVAHYAVIEKKDILLLTDKRIVYATHNDVFGGWQAEWAYAWKDITTPAAVLAKGIQIPVPEGKRKKLGIFGSNGSHKLVLIQNENLKEEIVKKIEELRSSA